MTDRTGVSATTGKATTVRPTSKIVASVPAETRFFVVSELEEAIEQMPKVHGVRINAGERGIDEIHVLSAKDIAPKALVRDIVTLLLVRFGVRVDRRCVSIVQSSERPYAQVGRPVIQKVTVDELAGARIVSVELSSGSWTVSGRHALADDQTEMDGGSIALIDAVEKLVGRRQLLELREAKALTLGDRELVVVLVAWQSGPIDESFAGSALADSGYAAGAARATLDAINRKLVRLPIMVDS